MKKTLTSLIALTLVASLIGCGGGGTGSTGTDNKSVADKPADTSADSSTPAVGDKTVTVWCWDPAFNIFAMNEAAKIYGVDHSDVTIDVVETPWDDVQTKLTTSVTSGQTDLLPEIMLMQDNALVKNVTNYPDTFADLSNSGIDFSKFAAYKVALSSADGKNFGVPFDNGVAITALRTDVLTEAGFTVEDFTDITWSQFFENGKVVLEKTGKPMLSCQAGSPDLLMCMLQSAGVWLFKDGQVYIKDNEVLKEIIDIYTQLVKAGVVVEVNNWDQYIATLNNSTVAATVQGCWIIGSLTANKDQEGLWAITNIPKLEKAPNATNYSSQGGSSWVVTADSKNSDAAVDFLKNTFASSVQLYETILPSSGALGTYLPAGESKVYGEPQVFFGNSPIFETITSYASKVPQVSYGVYNYEARDAVGTAITTIMSGADVDAALGQAESEVKFQMGQ